MCQKRTTHSYCVCSIFLSPNMTTHSYQCVQYVPVSKHDYPLPVCAVCSCVKTWLPIPTGECSMFLCQNMTTLHDCVKIWLHNLCACIWVCAVCMCVCVGGGGRACVCMCTCMYNHFFLFFLFSCVCVCVWNLYIYCLDLMLLHKCCIYYMLRSILVFWCLLKEWLFYYNIYWLFSVIGEPEE